MNFSPSAKAWSRGLLPSLCSMVAVCEVVDHPEIRYNVSSCDKVIIVNSDLVCNMEENHL